MRPSFASLFFIIILPLLIGLAFFTVQFKTDMSAFLITGENAEEILLASEIQSGTLSRRYILSIDAGQNQVVAPRFIETWIAKIKTIPEVNSLWRANEQKNTLKSLSTLYTKHATQLYSREPEKTLAQIFTQSALSQRAEALKQALLSPQASVIKKIAVQDPLLLSLNGFKSFADQFKKTALQQTGQYANFILVTDPSGMDIEKQRIIQAEIKRYFSENTKNLAYTLEMTGVPIFAAATQTMIQTDIQQVSLLSTIALILLFLVLFRSFKVLFWVSSLLLFVISVALLTTQLIFGSVHGMTIAIGSTLIGICIDYPIHAIVHAQGSEPQHRLQSIKTIFPSLAMGALTTLIGYIALGISGYPGFQQVAIYASTGIISSLLLTRYLFPYLITGKVKKVNTFKFIIIWSKFCQSFRPYLVAVVILLSAFSVIKLDNLQWMQDLQQLTPELDYLKLNDKKIRERLVSMEPGRFILVSGKTPELALQYSEQLYPLLEHLKQSKALDDYFGLYPWILSQQQQQKNQAFLAKSLTTEHQIHWQAALKQQKLSVKRLGDLDRYSHSVKTLTPQEILSSPIAPLINNQLIINAQQTLLIIWLGKHNPEALKLALKDREHIQYFSQRDLLNRMAIDYQNQAEITLLSGLALILCLLSWRYKSILLAIKTLSPAVISALLILALWASTGEAISFLHLVGFLLAVAICVDYGIFYQENRSGNISLTYQAMAASMLTSALVFGCLLIAQTSTLQTLAKVVTLGIILGFLLCPILIKPRPFIKP